MIAIGFGIAWLGYALSFYGFSLVKGYDLSLRDVISPSGYYKGPWPPSTAGNTVIFPGQQPPANCGSTTATTGTSTTQPKPHNGRCPAGYYLKNGKCYPSTSRTQ